MKGLACTPPQILPRRPSRSQDASGQFVEVSKAAAEAAATGELPPEVREALSKLDDRLVEVLKRGDARLVRSAWLLAQSADYRMQRRQDLEALAPGPSGVSPLLSAEEAVELVRRGKRSAGALTYGWLTPGNPDPAGARIAVLRRLLEQHPHIEGLFWE